MVANRGAVGFVAGFGVCLFLVMLAGGPSNPSPCIHHDSSQPAATVTTGRRDTDTTNITSAADAGLKDKTSSSATRMEGQRRRHQQALAVATLPGYTYIPVPKPKSKAIDGTKEDLKIIPASR